MAAKKAKVFANENYPPLKDLTQPSPSALSTVERARHDTSALGLFGRRPRGLLRKGLTEAFSFF